MRGNGTGGLNCYVEQSAKPAWEADLKRSTAVTEGEGTGDAFDVGVQPEVKSKGKRCDTASETETTLFAFESFQTRMNLVTKGCTLRCN